MSLMRKKRTLAYLLIMTLVLAMIPVNTTHAEGGEQSPGDEGPQAPPTSITKDMYEFNEKDGVYEYTIGYWDFWNEKTNESVVHFDSIEVPSGNSHLAIVGVDVYTDKLTIGKDGTLHIWDEVNWDSGEKFGTGRISCFNIDCVEGAKLELSSNQNTPRIYNAQVEDKDKYSQIDIYDYLPGSDEPMSILGDAEWGGYTFAYDSANERFIVCSHGDEGPQAPPTSITKDMYEYNPEAGVFEYTLGFWQFENEENSVPVANLETIEVPSGEYHLAIIGVDVYTDHLSIGANGTLHIWNSVDDGSGEVTGFGRINYKNYNFADDAKIELDSNKNTPRIHNDQAEDKYSQINIYDFIPENPDEPTNILGDDRWGGYTFAYDSASERFIVCSHGEEGPGPQDPNDPQNPPQDINFFLQRLSDELAVEDFAFSKERAKEGITVEIIGDMVNGGRYQQLGEKLGFNPGNRYKLENIKAYSDCVTIEENRSYYEWVYPGDLGQGTVLLEKYKFKINLKSIATRNGVEDTDWIKDLPYSGQVWFLPTERTSGDTYHGEKEMDYANIDSYVVVRVGIYAEGYGYMYYLRNCAQDSGDFESLNLGEGENNSRAIKVVTDQPLYDDNGHPTVKMFGNHINLNENEIISGDKSKNLFVATFHGDGNEENGYIGGKIAVYKEKASNFVGAYIRNKTDTPIPEYDDANTAYPIVDVADNYQGPDSRGVEVPSVDRFFGYKDFEIYLTDTEGIGNGWIEKAEVKYAEKSLLGNEEIINYINVPNEAISIEAKDGYATLSFKSDYYDNALVILTDNMNRQHCFSINRTGIVISAEMTGGDRKNVLPVRHGHIESTEMRMPDDSDFGYGIYATYYYPDKAQSEADVDLFVTLTYSDNSCEYKLISSDHFKASYPDQHGTKFAAASDYFIYMGSADHLEVPVKVEAIAVPKAGADGRINGAKFGSGSGVLKNIEIRY